MAELLIWHRSYVPADAVADMAGWRPGDVVSIMPDGHRWGREETEPTEGGNRKFLILRVPGAVADHQAFLAEIRNPEDLLDGALVARRAQRIALESLPRAVRGELLDTGRATLTSLRPLSDATTLLRTRRRLTTADR